jgi:hypothetical protein
MLTDVTKVKYVDADELKVLWRILERLQADVTPVGGASVGRGWIWSTKEVDALVTVMDAVRDTYEMVPIEAADRAALDKDPI